jgi:RING finger protein 121
MHPLQVYGWFLGAYKVSVAVGVSGYILLVLDMFGIGLLLARWVEPGLSLLLLWYGLYFGILGRDLAEVASEQMVRRWGRLGACKRVGLGAAQCFVYVGIVGG